MHGKEIRNKTKKKWIEKYGSDNPARNSAIKQKIKNTNQIRLGVNMPAQNETVRQKFKLTCMKRYGYDNPFKGNQSKLTCMKKYGVPNPMSNPEIYNKINFYKRKLSKMPSGKDYYYQGYENVAIDKLLISGILETDIFIGDATKIPQIKYHNPIKNKICHYYPDIFVKSKNLLIEVKSEYTITKNVEINNAKHYACISAGISHEIWICSKNAFIKRFI